MDLTFPNWSFIFQSRWRLCIVLLVLGCLLTLPFLDQTRLVHEEPRRALIADNMLQSGEVLVPVEMDRYYTAKPPLFNWLIVASSYWQGYVDEFSARIPSVICLLTLAVAMVLGMGRRLRAPGLSFLGFATLLSPQMLMKGTLAEIEMIFTLLVTLSLWTWYWRYDEGERGIKLWLLPSILVALSFLAKREPSIIFYYFSIIGFLIYKRQISLLGKPAHLLCAGGMAVIIGWWLAVMINKVGLDAMIESSVEEVLHRGLTEAWVPLIKHLLFYPVEVLFAAFPFSLLLLPLFSARWRDKVYRRNGDITVFALIAVLINLPIYWFRTDAAVRYFMPMLPTALVLAAYMFQTLVEDAEDDPGGRWVQFYLWGAVVLCFVLGAAPIVVVWVPELQEMIAPLVLPEWTITVMALLFITAVVYQITRIGSNTVISILPFFVLFVIAFRLLYFDVLLPYQEAKLREERNLPKLVEVLDDLVPEEYYPIQVVGDMQQDVWFYMGRDRLVTIEKLGLEYPTEYFMILSNQQSKFLTGMPFQWETVYRMRYRDRDLVVGKVHIDNKP